MGFSDYLWDELNDHVMNDGAYTAPTWYVGLSTTTPNADGTNVTEPAGGSYARVSTDADDWNASSSQVKTNANAIIFPEATGSWGTVTYVVLYDAATNGNLLGFGVLGSSEAIGSGQIAKFAAGQLSVGKA